MLGKDLHFKLGILDQTKKPIPIVIPPKTPESDVEMVSCSARASSVPRKEVLIA